MRRGVLLVVPTLAALALPGVADALWNATAGGSTRVVSATVANASGFTAACGSVRGRTLSIGLSWTASPTAFVTGYQILRTATGDGTNATISVAGRTTSSHTDSVSTDSATYSYTIRALGSGWTSGTVTAARTVLYDPSDGCTTA